MVRRSLLYCPGDDTGKMETAVRTPADAVVFDLEDAVVPERKADARRAVREMLDRNAERDADRESDLAVRINPYDRGGADDVAAVVGEADEPPDSVVLPKAERPEAVERLRADLQDRGGETVGIVPLIETARGVVAAEEIAAEPGVTGVAYGDQDFTADVGATVTADKTESLYARQRLVVAASAAGVEAFDTVYTEIGDREGLREQTDRIVEWGFDGKLAIHPDQVPVINAAYTPEPAAVEWAETVVDRAEGRDADAAGAFVVDGQMIDPPLIERARTILERADAGDVR